MLRNAAVAIAVLFGLWLALHVLGLLTGLFGLVVGAMAAAVGLVLGLVFSPLVWLVLALGAGALWLIKKQAPRA
jgi:hypothetical protein